MFQRTVNIPKEISFFLFGSRGTGKSTLLKSTFPHALRFDLLDEKTERDLTSSPGNLQARILAHLDSKCPVVLDEIQKAPQLLDEIHRFIEGDLSPRQYILTGSSARKLKAGGANLLAGRATIRHLFPLTSAEMGSDFQLHKALEWGTLPLMWTTPDDSDRRDRLEAYASTYLKEEVWGEQLIRKLDPFRRFLEVAAQMNGKIVNATRIARDVGADVKTVQAYYQILEDTLLGFSVDAYHSSVRKRLSKASKFYFFDAGVVRALSRLLTIPLAAGTSAYGEVFESFLVNEIYRKNSYERRDYRLHYLLTPAGLEIDLVIERPGRPLALVEIKSTPLVRHDHVAKLQSFEDDFHDADFYCLSNDPNPKRFGRVHALPWNLGLKEI